MGNGLPVHRQNENLLERAEKIRPAGFGQIEVKIKVAERLHAAVGIGVPQGDQGHMPLGKFQRIVAILGPGTAAADIIQAAERRTLAGSVPFRADFYIASVGDLNLQFVNKGDPFGFFLMNPHADFSILNVEN